MNFACFWVIFRVAADDGNLTLEDLNGLYIRAPVLAFVLAVSAFSLVGLSQTAGFMGKLFLLAAARDHGYNWLVIPAAVNTVIRIYYYLNLVRHAYTKEAPLREPAKPRRYSPIFGGLGLASLLILLGTLPGPVFDVAVAASSELMGR